MYTSKIKSIVKIPKNKENLNGWGKMDPIYEKAIMDEKQDLSYRANVANSNLKQYHDFVISNPKIDQNTLPRDYREMRSEADIEVDEMYQRELLIKNCARIFPNNISRGNELIQLVLDKNYSKYFNKFFAKIFRLLNSDYGQNYFPSDVINVIQQEMLKDDKSELELDLVLNPKAAKQQNVMNEPLTSGIFITILQSIYNELNTLIADSNNQTAAMQNILIDSRNKAVALEATIGAMANNMLQPQSKSAPAIIAPPESKSTDRIKDQAKKGMDSALSAIKQLTPRKTPASQPPPPPPPPTKKGNKQSSVAAPAKTPDPVMALLSGTVGTTPDQLMQNASQFQSVLQSGQVPTQPLLSTITGQDLEKSINKSRATTDFIHNYEACVKMQPKVSGYTSAIMKRTLTNMFGYDSTQLPDGRSNNGVQQIRVILQDKVDEYIEANRDEYDSLTSA